MSMKISFTKMVGAGNDFVIVDARRSKFSALQKRWPALSRAWCDRHQGIGADGVLLLEPSKTADARMRVFNVDGSEAEMCGNGAPCVAHYLAEMGNRRQVARNRKIAIETKAGVLQAEVRGERAALQMSEPTGLALNMPLALNGHTLQLSIADTGVPHVVVHVDSIETVDVAGLGRAIRTHATFAPRGTNVNFIQRDPEQADRIRIRTYERGVEAETLACGTGATAAAVIHALNTRGAGASNGHPELYRIDVQTRSGETLTVSFDLIKDRSNVRAVNVILEGPARRVFEGTMEQ